jgi:chromosome segregation ATPase
VDCEAWVAPDGRFRLAALAGAWTKPAAVYIGHAARAAARVRRLADIAGRLREIAGELTAVQTQDAQLVRDQDQAADEWRLAPAEVALRNAHLAAVASAREVQIARQQLTEADSQYQAAEQALQTLRQLLAADAADLRLPASSTELPAVETALSHYHDAQSSLAQAAHEVRLALPEMQRQRNRENETRDDLNKRHDQSMVARIQAGEAAVRLHVLRASVGAEVEEMQRRLADARTAVEARDKALNTARDVLGKSGEARAIAGEKSATASAAFRERSDARAEAISKFQHFASTGLLAAALRCRGLTCPTWTARGRSIRRSLWLAAPNRRCPNSRTTTRPGRASNGRSATT